MRFITLAFMLLISVSIYAQAPRAEPPKAVLTLEDQFERPQDIAQFRGGVLVILYGDRDGMPANKSLGENLHVKYHPSAKGQPPAVANKAPVVPLEGLPEGVASPDVRVLPVACIGKVPGVIRDFIRGRIKKEAPDSLVLLDFETKMKDQFGMKSGEPNLVVIDAAGRMRMKMSGELDAASYKKLTDAIDYLRKEAVK